MAASKRTGRVWLATPPALEPRREQSRCGPNAKTNEVRICSDGYAEEDWRIMAAVVRHVLSFVEGSSDNGVELRQR